MPQVSVMALIRLHYWCVQHRQFEYVLMNLGGDDMDGRMQEVANEFLAKANQRPEIVVWLIPPLILIRRFISLT